MTDYSKMSDSEINRKVADIIYPGDKNITPYSHRPDVQVFHKNDCNSLMDYCNSWSDAGPIIVENKISIDHLGKEIWGAKAFVPNGEPRPRYAEKNPLRAAMIVFLMMKELENV